MTEESPQSYNVLDQLQDENIEVNVKIQNEEILEEEYLSKSEEYYDLHSNIIKKNYPQGYQIGLIKNKNCKSKSLRVQNFSYLAELVNIRGYSDCNEGEKTTSIVEIGCGNGQFINYLSSVEKYRGFNYFGIDISENQLKNAENSTEYNRKSFCKIDMHVFVSNEPYFDVCFFIESIGYVIDLETMVQNISTGIKLGGYVVIKNPIRIIVDKEKHQEIKEKFLNIETEYGYEEYSLGMFPDKSFIEKIFLNNGFELEKFEIPDYDTETYNKTFCKNKILSNSHPSYINHILNTKSETYYPNQYLECAIFVFKKVKNI